MGVRFLLPAFTNGPGLIRLLIATLFMTGIPRSPINSAHALRRSPIRASWIGIWVLGAMLSACGFRNDPQPPTNLIPAVEDLRARFRDDHILVSWKQPQSGSVRLQGAVQSYELIIRRVPLA